MANDSVKKTAKGSGEYKGYTGTSVYAGYFSEEYLTEWESNDALNTFEKMRRSDAQVKMVLNAIKNPLRSAKYTHTADGKADDQQAEIAQYLDWVWFGNPFFKFSQWLSEALTFLDFGFSIHEKKFAMYDHPDFGLVHTLTGMGFRKQLSIESWEIDNKGLHGVRQLAYGDTVKGSGDVVIPVERLSILTNEREGDNWEGLSLLRSIYGAWLRKNLYLKLVAIGIEKAAIGTPVGKYPRGSETSTDKEKFIESMQAFALHESSYMVIPSDYEIELIKIPFDADKIMTAIAYEDVQMSKSILFQFLELGTNSSSGSFALGSDMSDFALAALQFVGDYIAESMDDISERLVRWNFGDKAKTPKCKCSGINQKAGKELSEIIEKVVNTQVVRPDDRLEAHVREVYNLPMAETTREEDEAKVASAAKDAAALLPKPVADPKPDPKPVADPKEEPEPEPTPEPKLAESQRRSRDLTEYENAESLANTETAMQTESEKLHAFMISELTRIRDRALRGVTSLLKRHTKGDRVKAAEEFNLTLKSYETSLTRQFIDGAQAGMKTARNDLATKLSEYSLADNDVTQFLPEHVKKALKLQSKYQAVTHGAEIEKIITLGIMNGVENDLTDAAIIEEISADLDTYIESGKITNASSTATAQNMARGREAWFYDKENIKQIQAFQYSAILDGRTTDICLSLDNQIMLPHDPALARLRPPNHYNCRSILVPITVNEKKPVITGLQVDPTNPPLVAGYKDKGKAPPSMAKIQKSRNL